MAFRSGLLHLEWIAAFRSGLLRLEAGCCVLGVDAAFRSGLLRLRAGYCVQEWIAAFKGGLLRFRAGCCLRTDACSGVVWRKIMMACTSFFWLGIV